MTDFCRVEILGVPVQALCKADLLAQVAVWSQQDCPRTITYANAHCLNIAQDDLAYRRALRQADLVYSDGIGAVWAARWLAGLHLEKLTGRVWIDDLCALACADGLRLYLLGGRPGVAARASQSLQRNFPELQIAAARDGFFVEMSEADVFSEIAHLRPHLVLVGMGVPRQDLWITANRAYIQAPVCWSVGALFDFVAGIEQSVPAWMDALALEWLWRMLVNPAQKWRRYLVGNPRFLLRVAKQKWSG